MTRLVKHGPPPQQFGFSLGDHNLLKKELQKNPRDVDRPVRNKDVEGLAVFYQLCHTSSRFYDQCTVVRLASGTVSARSVTRSDVKNTSHVEL
jgi:hypothetical protein